MLHGKAYVGATKISACY